MHQNKPLCLAILILGFSTSAGLGAPSAEVAKKCIKYAYIAHPFKRPGSAPGSPLRQMYFNDCLAKNGDIPAPAPLPKPDKK